MTDPLEQDTKDDQSNNLSRVSSTPASVKWGSCTEEQDQTASNLSGTTSRKRHHRHKKSSSSVSNGDRIKSKRTVGDYNLTTTLGSGGMGKVKLGIHQQHPQKKVTKGCLYLIFVLPWFHAISWLSKSFKGNMTTNIGKNVHYVKPTFYIYCIIHTLSISKHPSLLTPIIIIS